MRRVAAKVVLVSTDGCVLLFRGVDLVDRERGAFWFVPGGGAEPGESLEQTARREVLEETGLRLGEVGPIAARREVAVVMNGVPVVSEEHYFVITVERFDVDASGWTELERQTISEHRWWPLDELRLTGETVYPEGLARLVDAHRGGSAGILRLS